MSYAERQFKDENVFPTKYGMYKTRVNLDIMHGGMHHVQLITNSNISYSLMYEAFYRG